MDDFQHVKRTAKGTPPPGAPLSPSLGQDSALPSDTGAEDQVMSVKSQYTRTQITGDQSKAGSPILDKTNARTGSPRKPLPPLFRIGAPPAKPAKPDHLKFRLIKWQDKVIFAKRLTVTAGCTFGEGRPKTYSICYFVAKTTVEPN